MPERTGSLILDVFNLLLQRAHALVILGVIIFFIGPTCLSGYLVWRLSDSEDKALIRITSMLMEHASSTKLVADTLEQSREEEKDYRIAMIKIAAETCKTQANTNATARLCDEIARNWLDR